MVLRSGIIIPFQFRDAKKLLMIGVPEENRDLSIWDLKNVVRAAFGIYNFEFRNKKIGFNIPDELLLHYLAQRHDLTNFVIEIGQAGDLAPGTSKELLSFEPSCSTVQQQQKVLLPQKTESFSETQLTPTSQNYVTTSSAALQQRGRSPANSDQSSNAEGPPHKIRISQIYTVQTPESLTQSIDPMDIIPKSEQVELEEAREQQTAMLRQQLQQQQQQQQQQHQQLQQQQAAAAPHFFSNYAHGQNMLLGSQQLSPAAAAAQQQYSPALINRFRRRGERMSKDQKELYVKYFEENTCMLTQRRNDIMLEPHWNKLASILNSVPQGAVKNVEEWKQTFDAWRYRVFMYTRYNSKLTGAAAQNPKNYKPLTPTDQRAYAMWTSHKNTAPTDYEKMDMFSHLEETQVDYDY